MPEPTTITEAAEFIRKGELTHPAVIVEQGDEDEPDDANVTPGNGPGAGYVHPVAIGFLAAYLLALTLGIIWQIAGRWPNCDPNVQTSAPSAGKSLGGTSTTGTAGSTGKKSTDKPAGSEPASGSTGCASACCCWRWPCWRSAAGWRGR